MPYQAYVVGNFHEYMGIQEQADNSEWQEEVVELRTLIKMRTILIIGFLAILSTIKSCKLNNDLEAQIRVTKILRRRIRPHTLRAHDIFKFKFKFKYFIHQEVDKVNRGVLSVKGGKRESPIMR
ncbi:hypothetical protein PRIPAC_81312 [Pristionchus pacificus]|uniref:Uncharacterized protein n=1 Tax=Pristionchus pacificus TaxID=54126 RepID=A0A2A6CM32_PRIPA|nr:hypothetical protein PRIPAC_81312 [Pristionchus pacificus]|eukprot:PDM79137.1 hypothetical protein PRIPAC_31716 [Pristionchus pacificus]